MSTLVLALVLAAGAETAASADEPLGSLLARTDAAPVAATGDAVTPRGVVYRLLGWTAALCVLGTAAVGIWKRAAARPGGIAGGRGLRVVSRTALSQRHLLYLVRVGNERMLLLGVSGDRIATLTEFKDAAQVLALDGSFAETLKGVGVPTSRDETGSDGQSEPDGPLLPFRREIHRLRSVVSGWRDRLQGRETPDHRNQLEPQPGKSFEGV